MRNAFRLAALAAAIQLSAGTLLRAQDTVYYLDPKTNKEVDVSGDIKEESPAGVQVQTAAGLKLIPALDIRQITYRVTGVTATAFRRGDFLMTKAADARGEERTKLLQEALQEMERLMPMLQGHANAMRYYLFRMAQIKALQARDDPTKLDAAVEALKGYKTGYVTSWEIVPCLRQLAELEEGRNNIDGALAAYEELADIPDVPKSIQRTASMLVVQLLMRRSRHAEAEGRLVALRAKMADDEPERPLVEVLLTQVQMAQNKLDTIEKQLKTALKSSVDPNVRATAHNVLGDYYVKKNQGEEAFWQYLRVDVMYSQDKTQHAKALYNLWKLFDKVKNDPIRAQEVYDRLLDKEYAGTEFQDLARAEKKPAE